MLPTKDTNHQSEARALLIEQFKGRAVLTGLLDVLSRRVQDLEGVLWDIIDKRVLGTATAAQLDALGGLVGEKRLGRSDALYEKVIRIRIRVNRSQGRAADVLDVSKLWNALAEYTEYAFLGWEVDVRGDLDPGSLAKLLAQAKASTSYGQVVGSTWSADETFTFCHAGATPNDNQKFWSAYVT